MVLTKYFNKYFNILKKKGYLNDASTNSLFLIVFLNKLYNMNINNEERLIVDNAISNLKLNNW